MSIIYLEIIAFNPMKPEILDPMDVIQEPVPPGFSLVSTGRDTYVIHHKRTGKGCLNVFLLIWLTGWTFGCVFLLRQYLNGGTLEDGDPMPLWFVSVFWITEVIVAWVFIRSLFNRGSFQLVPYQMNQPKITPRIKNYME